MPLERVTVGVVVLLLALSPAFVLDTGGRAEPAPFDDLVTVGETEAAVSAVEAAGGTIPRAQVRYARFEFAVGYYGVESLVSRLERPDHRRRYGRALSVHVTDAGANARVGEDGILRTDGPRRWVRAESAHFVVGSEARTPAGPAVVPFAARADAERFARDHGGRVVGWAELRETATGTVGRSTAAWRETVAARSERADRTAAAAGPHRDRPVAATVAPGESVAAAVARAPPNTTVRLEPGVHRVADLVVEKPLTLRGAGRATVLRGDGNGTAVEFRADRSVLADLRVAGVGERTTGNLSGVEGWEERVRLAYATADAGVRFVRANRSLVADVGVRTGTNGVVFVDSPGGVVRETRIVGERPAIEGYMSVLAFRSRIVVQNTTVYGGRDGVYTHRSHGTVVRDSQMREVRFGVHTMYTSRALVQNVTVSGADVGVVVMTRPTGNAVVDVVATDADIGISLAGSRSFVADSVVYGADTGLQTATTGSRYVGNLLAHNQLGARAGALLPTNRVHGNAFVDNRRHAVDSPPGSLRVWTGNYWTGAPGVDRDGDGALDRAFRPTGTADGPASRVAGGPVLARAPAVALLRGTRATLPGFRRPGVLDPAPLAAPPSPPGPRLAAARGRVERLPGAPARVVPPLTNRTEGAA
ncbi:MAG: NosD domain-containing protein [Haloferacaceae archaeon]